jgi:hypothetical protein
MRMPSSRSSWHLILLTVSSPLLIFGCAATEEYQKISQAGSAYINAVDSLLDVSANISIDSTSERLLASDRLAGIDQLTYDELSAPDLEWLILLGQVRQHNQLLAEYFSLLGDLATSDAPERSQTSINNIATNLATAGGSLSSNPSVAANLAGPVTRLIVNSQIRGALGDELELRKDVIQRELVLQEALLEVLAGQISNDLDDIRTLQEDRLVEASLLSDVPIADSQKDIWIRERRRILLLQTTSDKLVAAKEASSQFRKLFEDLVQGGLTTQRIDLFLNDIEDILEVIESAQDSQSTSVQQPSE